MGGVVYERWWFETGSNLWQTASIMFCLIKVFERNVIGRDTATAYRGFHKDKRANSFRRKYSGYNKGNAYYTMFKV